MNTGPALFPDSPVDTVCADSSISRCMSGLDDALLRERRLKAWRRAWMIDLIEHYNPGWCDLSSEIPY